MAPANKSARPYDLLVFGTGFTGTLVAEYLAKNYAHTVKFAIGGRSQQKLNALKQKLVKIDPACEKVGVLVADSFDGDALENMLKQTKAVVSTVGPYYQYGFEMVAACVRAGTNYADITGESPFVAEYTAKHDAEAKRKGVLLVSMCGFDSIPSDLGTFMVGDYIRQTFNQPVASVRSSVTEAKGGVSAGTVLSLIGLFDLPLSKLRNLAADPYALNPANVRGVDKTDPIFNVFYDKNFQSWQGPFFMAPINQVVVRRSNGLTGNKLYGPSFSYKETMSLPNVIFAALTALMMNLLVIVVLPLVKIPLTRSLLYKFLPASGSGPTREQIENGKFAMEFVAESEPLENGERRRAHGIVSGGEPGYGETAKMLAEAGLALSLDKDKLPAKGGSMTPATAMGHVLIDRLKDAGMTFAVSKA